MLEFISYKKKVLLQEGDSRKAKERCRKIYICFKNGLVYFGLRTDQNVK